jgi:hypothetical protein
MTDAVPFANEPIDGVIAANQKIQANEPSGSSSYSDFFRNAFFSNGDNPDNTTVKIKPVPKNENPDPYLADRANDRFRNARLPAKLSDNSEVLGARQNPVSDDYEHHIVPKWSGSSFQVGKKGTLAYDPPGSYIAPRQSRVYFTRDQFEPYGGLQTIPVQTRDSVPTTSDSSPFTPKEFAGGERLTTDTQNINSTAARHINQLANPATDKLPDRTGVSSKNIILNGVTETDWVVKEREAPFVVHAQHPHNSRNWDVWRRDNRTTNIEAFEAYNSEKLAKLSQPSLLTPKLNISKATWHNVDSAKIGHLEDTNLRIGRLNLHAMTFGGTHLVAGIAETAQGDPFTGIHRAMYRFEEHNMIMQFHMYPIPSEAGGAFRGIASAVMGEDKLVTFGGYKVSDFDTPLNPNDMTNNANSIRVESVDTFAILSVRGGGSRPFKNSVADTIEIYNLPYTDHTHFSPIGVSADKTDYLEVAKREALKHGVVSSASAFNPNEYWPRNRAYANMVEIAPSKDNPTLNRVLMFGGVSSTAANIHTPLTDVWIMTLDSNKKIFKWNNIGSIPFEPRILGGVIAYANKTKVIVFGGTPSPEATHSVKDVWVFDVETMEWTEVYNRDRHVLPGTVAYHADCDPFTYIDFASVLLPDETILIDGGRTPPSATQGHESTIATYFRTWIMYLPGTPSPESSSKLPANEIRLANFKADGETLHHPTGMYGHSAFLRRVDADNATTRNPDMPLGRSNVVVRFCRGKVDPTDGFGEKGELISRPKISHQHPDVEVERRDTGRWVSKWAGTAPHALDTLAPEVIAKHRDNIVKALDLLTSYPFTFTYANGSPVLAENAPPSFLLAYNHDSFAGFLRELHKTQTKYPQMVEYLTKKIHNYNELVTESAHGKKVFSDADTTLPKKVHKPFEEKELETEGDVLTHNTGVKHRVVPYYDFSIAYAHPPSLTSLGRGIFSKAYARRNPEDMGEKYKRHAQTGLIAAAIVVGIIVLLFLVVGGVAIFRDRARSIAPLSSGGGGGWV